MKNRVIGGLIELTAAEDIPDCFSNLKNVNIFIQHIGVLIVLTKQQ